MRRTKHVEELIEDDEQKPDFDDMMNEVQEEIEEHDAEDAVVSRAPELRQLSENIDKATNTWINATLQLNKNISSVRCSVRRPFRFKLSNCSNSSGVR